jgi:hypothetical protein
MLLIHLTIFGFSQIGRSERFVENVRQKSVLSLNSN